MKTSKNTIIAALTAFALLTNAAAAETAGHQDDATVAANIRQAIAQHPGLRTAIRIQVREGITYVYGTLDTYPEEVDAIEMIRKVSGVGKVVDMTSTNNA